KDRDGGVTGLLGIRWDVTDQVRAEDARMEAEEIVRKQAEEILAISTPVVQIWDGVVAAPLIGTLDSRRTQQVMEQLLQRIVDTRSSVALIDITGVPGVDTQTARHLIETVAAVRLLGAQVVLTGIRPAIAQTLVHLGVDLSNVTTRSSLAAGLRVALDLLNLQVIAKDGSR
ncbi:MAG: STAS domain-containing protein, partial [Actinobacteria bacterium]|nr:STAS domain-containing protein [Actinomycetota bacterium]